MPARRRPSRGVLLPRVNAPFGEMQSTETASSWTVAPYFHQNHTAPKATNPPFVKDGSFLQPVESEKDDSMKICHLLLMINIRKFCRVAWKFPLTSPITRGWKDVAGWISSKQLALIHRALAEATSSNRIDRVLMNPDFGQVVLCTKLDLDIISWCNPGEASIHAGFGSPSSASSNICLQNVTKSPRLLSNVFSGQYYSQSTFVVLIEHRARYVGQWGNKRITTTDRMLGHRDWRVIKLFFNACAKNMQIIGDVYLGHANDVNGWDEDCAPRICHEERGESLGQSSRTRDNWVFYNYYPQVTSLLGIEQEEARRNFVVSSVEDNDERSCNDSGIDIHNLRIPIARVTAVQWCDDTHDNVVRSGMIPGLAGNPSSRNSNITTSSSSGTPSHRWSMDEMIALSLLEAMQTRSRTDHHANLNRRRKMSIRRVIVRLFRKFCASLLA